MKLTMKPEETHHTTPDESITNKQVQGRFVLPKVGNMSTQPQQQQVIVQGRQQRKIPSSMDQDTKEEEVLRIILWAQQTVCHKDQPLQHLHCKLEDHHGPPQSAIKTEITRIHQTAMEPPMDPPEYLQIAKAQELLKQRIVRYNVPKFPHSSATFNIILGSHILASPEVLQGSLGDSTFPTQCSQPCPVPANRNLTGLTWFPIVRNYIK